MLIGSPVWCPASTSVQTLSYKIVNATSANEGAYSVVVTPDGGTQTESASALVTVDTGAPKLGNLEMLRTGVVYDISGAVNNALIGINIKVPINEVMRVGASASSDTTFAWYWAPLKGGVYQTLQYQVAPFLDFSSSYVPKLPGYFALCVTTKRLVSVYKFVISNFCSAWTAGYSINTPLLITSNPRTVAVAPGGSATFNVGVSGKPVAYLWYRLDKLNNRTLLRITTSPYMTLSNVSDTDASYSYLCVVLDGTTNTKESSAAGIVITPLGE